MKPPAIGRVRYFRPERRPERGVTMVLVAVAMVAIIAMAALSIDVVTLYLAREEAQRSADAAALAAARIISLSGITGDPGNTTSLWPRVCGGAGSSANQVAQAVGMQDSVGGNAPTVTVTYSAGSGGSISSNPDCSAVLASAPAFGLNPMVTVQVQQPGLPTFFSRIWGRSGNTVSATATAEAFNPSNSGNVGNQTTGTITPVQPRCVKPWVIPNRDPLNSGLTCDQGGGPCKTLVSTADGSITHQGISLNGGPAPNAGVIGETFWLEPDCVHNSATCRLRQNPPEANYYPNKSGYYELAPSLQYLPGEAAATPVAVPSCASGSNYEEAVAGCDQSTIYQCGVKNSNQIDLSENPGAATNDTLNGVQCLIQQSDSTNTTSSSGQDYLTPFAAPASYPFQILAGASTALGKAGLGGNPVSSSPSIVSAPIYDDTAPATINSSGTTTITIVGFLQVFINAVDTWGNVNVTVLNVAGCGNGSSVPNPAVTGSSPVPVRLVTPP